MIHVIILCQGQQSRLPNLLLPKQLMMLDRGEGKVMSILARTVQQVKAYVHDPFIEIVGRMHDFFHFENEADRAGKGDVVVHELVDPGNSSLKGLRRFLDYRQAMDAAATEFKAGGQPRVMRTAEYNGRDATIVLLGDVCYSNVVMKQIAAAANMTELFTFAVSDNLSASEGELWGITWPTSRDKYVSDTLDEALLKHPPFSEYQPGQMRRLLFTAKSHPAWFPSGFVSKSGDYTRDFDKPEDLAHLMKTAEHAYADDIKEKVPWLG